MIVRALSVSSVSSLSKTSVTQRTQVVSPTSFLAAFVRHSEPTTNYISRIANNLLGDDMPGGFCSTVELCVGILAACIATWRPLFNHIANRSTKLKIGSGNSNSKITPLGITPRNQPEQIRMSVKSNGVLSRTRDSDDKERLYTQMPEATEDPVDRIW